MEIVFQTGIIHFDNDVLLFSKCATNAAYSIEMSTFVLKFNIVYG